MYSGQSGYSTMKRNCHLSMSFPRYLKLCAISVLIFFIIESIIFNTAVLFFMWKFSSIFTQFVNAPGNTFIDKLSDLEQFRDVVSVGKEGGFSALLQHTVGRIYIESLDLYDSNCQNDSTKVAGLRLPHVSKIGVDVSASGEALFLLRRIKQRHLYSNVKWEEFIVDIGANDGLLSSNSNNFIRWGWSAILVEPQSYQLNLAKQNLVGFTNQHENQNVYFVNAVIGDKDGFVDFVLSTDIVAMESHVIQHKESTTHAVVKVQSYTVNSLAKQYIIPKKFGILSIDAEGMSNVILHQWIEFGCRPMYILYESLHEKETVQETSRYLGNVGYTYLTKVGWNHIFEYNGK